MAMDLYDEYYARSPKPVATTLPPAMPGMTSLVMEAPVAMAAEAPPTPPPLYQSVLTSVGGPPGSGSFHTVPPEILNQMWR